MNEPFETYIRDNNVGGIESFDGYRIQGPIIFCLRDQTAICDLQQRNRADLISCHHTFFKGPQTGDQIVVVPVSELLDGERRRMCLVGGNVEIV